MKKRYIRKLADAASGLVFPRICPVCGHILTENSIKGSPNPYICRKCYEILNFPQNPRCLRCSRPIMNELQEYCRSCERERKHFDQGIALMMHDIAAQKIIYDLKFSNKRDNADMLAFEAVQKCRDMILFWNPDMMIPVPLSRRKERDRGFNQALLLADRLSLYLEEQGISIPVRADILERTRETSPMKTLDSSQRKINIRGAFRINPGLTGHDKNSSGLNICSDITSSSILLIDDIYTSGATLSECAGVLKQAGAMNVYFLTFSIG